MDVHHAPLRQATPAMAPPLSHMLVPYNQQTVGALQSMVVPYNQQTVGRLSRQVLRSSEQYSYLELATACGPNGTALKPTRQWLRQRNDTPGYCLQLLLAGLADVQP